MALVPETDFSAALRRILRPLVRAAIARGLLFPELAALVKRLYVAEAARRFVPEGKKPTDSRLSVLTGLQRRDVKELRVWSSEQETPWAAGPLPRVLARWTAELADGSGRPLVLPRAAEEGPSFEGLAAAVTRDVHPRTLLDELVRRGLVSWDEAADEVRLLSVAFVAGTDESALLGYLGANLGDHAEAAVENVLAAPRPGRFFERAVHYDRLTPDSLAALERHAARLQTAALEELNSAALARQRADAGKAEAAGRFRCGAFVYRVPADDDPAERKELGE